MNKKIIDEAKKYVHELLKNEPPGHDWWHALRVNNNAKNIQQE
jgi:uncharacterized protein